MEALWKFPTVAVCAIFNSVIVLSGAHIIFDVTINSGTIVAVLVNAYVNAATQIAELASGEVSFKLSMILLHYFSVSILSSIIGELGFWKTYNPIIQLVSRAIHFLLWPIAPLWHVVFHSIFKRFATDRWKIDHIPYKHVIWAYWASIGYFYMFWLLTLVSAWYFGL